VTTDSARKPDPEAPDAVVEPHFREVACETGLRRVIAWEPEPPSRGLRALREGLNVYLVLTLDAAGLALEDAPEGAEWVLDTLPEAARPFTPALLHAADLDAVSPLVKEAWGKGALVCFLSKRSKEDLLGHLRTASRETGEEGSGLGSALCWPGTARALLATGDPERVGRLLEGIELVLVESQDEGRFEAFGADEEFPEKLREAGFTRMGERPEQTASAEA
jgi:hypothetical protein